MARKLRSRVEVLTDSEIYPAGVYIQSGIDRQGDHYVGSMGGRESECFEVDETFLHAR
jgi:hypothetical protein